MNQYTTRNPIQHLIPSHLEVMYHRVSDSLWNLDTLVYVRETGGEWQYDVFGDNWLSAWGDSIGDIL